MRHTRPRQRRSRATHAALFVVLLGLALAGCTVIPVPLPNNDAQSASDSGLVPPTPNDGVRIKSDAKRPQDMPVGIFLDGANHSGLDAWKAVTDGVAEAAATDATRESGIPSGDGGASDGQVSDAREKDE